MRFHPADVKPGSRKKGSEGQIELTMENESRDTTLRKSELVTGSAVGNLGQKISLGDVASDQSLKNQRDLNLRLVPVGMRDLRAFINPVLLWSISMT